MALQAGAIADMVVATQRDLGELRWTNLTSDLQKYIAMPSVIRKERVGFQSGYEVNFNVQTKTQQNARWTGLNDTDNVNMEDSTTNGQAPWRHIVTSYGLDRRLIKMNREPRRIFEMIKEKRNGAMIDFADKMEAAFWGKPTDSNDTLLPYGLFYWLVYNATEGFNGGAPAGFTTVANISPTTYPRWKNYSGQYTDVSKTDLIRKIRKAATFCNFMAPVSSPDYGGDDQWAYYTNYDVLGPMEEALEAQNDNLGNDIASRDGQVQFRRRPVNWVPYLEGNAGDPFIGINWSKFRCIFLTGEYMVEETVVSPTQHVCVNTFINCSLNFLCYDRRSLFALAKSDFAA